MIENSLDFIKEKIKHPGLQKHSKNIGWMFFARIGSMVITFIAVAYVARNLGPTNYGQLSYAISFTSLFGFLASLGVEQILYRELIKSPEKRDEYVGTALSLRIIAAFITLFICVLTASFLSTQDVSLLLIFIISLSFIFSSFTILGYEFQAEAKSKYPSILSLIVVFILNISKIGVIILDQGVIYLALVILMEPILYALGFLYLRTKNYGPIRNLSFSKNTAISILKDSFPLIFASAFFTVYARIDQVMIKNMVDASSVGLYDSAVRISEVWYFIPHILTVALFPAIINAKKVSDDLYHKRIRRFFLLIMSISFMTALFTTIFSKNLILTIFGYSFIGALPILQIYVWSNIGAAINLVSQQILISENLTKIISIITFFGMITNIILNIYLIPKYGAMGAAIASMISYIIPFLSLLLFKKIRRKLIDIIIT